MTTPIHGETPRMSDPPSELAPHLLWESVAEWAHQFDVRDFTTITAAFNLAVEVWWGLPHARERILATVAGIVPGEDVTLTDRDTLVAWAMITVMAPHAVCVCLDCRAFLPGAFREVPPASDDQAWHALVPLHMPGCPFVVSRGFRGDISAVAAAPPAANPQ